MTTIVTSITSTVGTNLDLTAGQDLYVAPSAGVYSQTVYGILADAGGHAIDIYGAVYGEDAGIRLENVGSSFGNSRVLVGVGASVSGRVVGIESLASSHSISVAGIVSGNNGFEHTGGTFSLHNSGSIIGSFGNGVDVDSNFGTIVNTGLIESTFSGAGVVLDNTTTSGSTTPTLANFGTISGTSIAISGDLSNRDTILNYGDVHGDISVSGEDDFVLNAGTVAGEVRLGSGNDTFDGRGGTVSEQVEGGSGEDTLLGGSSSDEMYGDFDADEVRGRDGDDYLSGGDDNDEVAGNRGDDQVDGNKGDDILWGNRGDDLVRGGSGDDTITGGRGNDTLVGNSGADIFVFNRRTDDDEIRDYANNVDMLDLSVFGLANKTALVNAGGIVANGAGSIIDLTTVGGDGVIYVDDMAVADWTGIDFIF